MHIRWVATVRHLTELEEVTLVGFLNNIHHVATSTNTVFRAARYSSSHVWLIMVHLSTTRLSTHP